MGQYFKVCLIDAEDQVFVLSPASCGQGRKLMEHCYYNGSTMNEVTRLLYKNPMRVVWLGDYAYQFDGSYYEHKVDSKFIEKLCKDVWRPDSVFDPVGDTVNLNESVHFEDGLPRYFVNHTLKKYFDIYALDYYVDEYGYAVHPLAVLTACGNGRGGGDFYGKGSEKAGLWAFDYISSCDIIPDGYSEEVCNFEEI